MRGRAEMGWETSPKKQLSLCYGDKPLILLAKASNSPLYRAIDEVYLNLVKASIGSS